MREGKKKAGVLGGLRLPTNFMSGVRCCSTAWRRMRVAFMLEVGKLVDR